MSGTTNPDIEKIRRKLERDAEASSIQAAIPRRIAGRLKTLRAAADARGATVADKLDYTNALLEALLEGRHADRS